MKTSGRPLASDGAGDTISRRLREYYEAVKDETIPDRFLELLERLDEADQAHKSRTHRGESPGQLQTDGGAHE
jgi:hypothetical protein